MQFLSFLFEAVWWIIMVDVVLSWVQRPDQQPRRMLMQLTNPLYAPFRAILSPEKTGGIDLSPIFVLLALRALRTVIAGHAF